MSDKRVITTGVPQGSILGLLLFLVYMNDISCTSQLFKFIFYDDDTTLFSFIEYSLPTCTSNVDLLLNNELIYICDWLIINKLSLNISKTKYMVLHPYQKYISQLVHLHTAVPHCSHSRAPIVHTAVPRENNEHGCVYLRYRAVCKLPGCVEGHPW